MFIEIENQSAINMTTHNLKLVVDDEIAEDYRGSFSENYDIISQCVMELEKNAEDTDFLEEIYRSLHTIKGNAGMCGFEELTQFTHTLEDVISSLQEGNIKFTEIVGEVILLTLDKIKEVSEDLFSASEVDFDSLKKIGSVLENIRSSEQDKIPDYANELISLITGHVVDSNTLTTNVASSQTADSDVKAIDFRDRDRSKTPAELDESLHYFGHLSSLLESKLPYWKNRIDRTLPLALSINEELGNPVTAHQLEAAIYMHDISFAFLSDSLVLADRKYNQDETQQMRSHPRLAANFVRLVPGWEEAVEIIYQHHEHWNGSGYPKGLQGDQICIGAQIVSIVDAYESMTHPRPDRQFKRSVLRAVTEINNCSGKQFSPDVTRVFNDMVRKMLAKDKK